MCHKKTQCNRTFEARKVVLNALNCLAPANVNHLMPNVPFLHVEKYE
jgi:hypothetical protein